MRRRLGSNHACIPLFQTDERQTVYLPYLYRNECKRLRRFEEDARLLGKNRYKARRQRHACRFSPRDEVLCGKVFDLKLSGRPEAQVLKEVAVIQPGCRWFRTNAAIEQPALTLFLGGPCRTSSSDTILAAGGLRRIELGSSGR